MFFISLDFFVRKQIYFYVNHMALVYLINKPQLSRRIARWVLLFLEYEFIIIYKTGKTHVVTNVSSRLPNSSEPLGILD
jgi:hypothetical protein